MALVGPAEAPANDADPGFSAPDVAPEAERSVAEASAPEASAPENTEAPSPAGEAGGPAAAEKAAEVEPVKARRIRKAKQVAEETPAAPAPEVVPDVVTVDEVRQALRELTAKRGVDPAREILKKFGLTAITDKATQRVLLPEEHFRETYILAREASAR